MGKNVYSSETKWAVVKDENGWTADYQRDYEERWNQK
ncbi:hypothetical protein CLV38_10590 [Alkalibacterium olivapovliticus]|uniref:Uncharacterized protein n=1 Tax=Alkalibacterium olivapovliticus TaxID=99907 RepID=A0A2T0W9C4_9LACT|nr:hypothetical protein CLV38_10590 [Alkalibacterium olivapovliticus]